MKTEKRKIFLLRRIERKISYESLSFYNWSIDDANYILLAESEVEFTYDDSPKAETNHRLAALTKAREDAEAALTDIDKQLIEIRGACEPLR